MGAGAAAAGAAAAMARAIKACGVIVTVEPDAFLEILWRQPDALVVCAEAGIFTTKYQYLTSYKGLAFFTKSASPLDLPPKCEVVTAGSVFIPG